MQQRNNGYVRVYSRISSGNIGNAGGLNTALNQPKRSGVFRHDIIQKKHSIIQRSIKSPPEHCIPTVERLYQSLFNSQLRQVGPEATLPVSCPRTKHHGCITADCNAPLRDLLFQFAHCRRMLRVNFLTRLHSRL